jgi:hypothetical protein
VDGRMTEIRNAFDVFREVSWKDISYQTIVFGDLVAVVFSSYTIYIETS